MSTPAKIEALYAKITNLEVKADAALKIDVSKLEEYFDRSYIIMKWFRALNSWKKMKIITDQRAAIIYKGLYTKYAKQGFFELKSKEIDTFIKADDEYKLINEEVELIKIGISFIEQVAKALEGQKFEIKELIAWKKFTKGED